MRLISEHESADNSVWAKVYRSMNKQQFVVVSNQTHSQTFLSLEEAQDWAEAMVNAFSTTADDSTSIIDSGSITVRPL